jgi:cellulose synthase operon protein C
MRKLNLAFVLGVAAVAAVLGVGIHFAHAYQVRRNVSALLDRARRAEAGGNLAATEESLSQFLHIKRADGPTWLWYARIVDQQAPKGRERERVYLVHEQALRYNPGDSQLERRCADLAMELGQYNDARRHIERLYLRAPKDPEGQPADPELEDLLGQCYRGESKIGEAEELFRKAIAHDPTRVASYDRLARMLRKNLRQQEAADQLIQEMVKANFNSARAHLSRWQYQSDFHPPADADYVKRALELDPDDPDVLLAAAGVSEQKGELTAARCHLRNGMTHAPTNISFPLMLANLEIRDGRLDSAEAVLRKAIEVNPKAELDFVLADTLISLGKIEGKDQAKDFIERVASKGAVDGYVKYLEARLLVREERWPEAIAKIDMARALLASDRRISSRLSSMLADCYGRLGLYERRLDALHQVAADETDRRRELADGLARTGQLDKSFTIHCEILDRRPESRFDLVRLLIQKVLRQPRGQRSWREVEERLHEAEKSLPKQTADLAVLRAEVLAAQSRLEEAQKLIATARAKEPRNIRFRVILANIAQQLGSPTRALELLDQAEQDLGLSLDLQIARLNAWVAQGGEKAKTAVAQLAQTCSQLPAAERPAFLEPLARAAQRLGDVPLARRFWRELLALQPQNIQYMTPLLDLAADAGDGGEVNQLVGKIREIEGEEGTIWRFKEATYLIDQAQKGKSSGLNTAEKLASEIVMRRGDWWGGPALVAQAAEVKGEKETAARSYLQAVKLGCSSPVLIRRLVGLLYERRAYDEIDSLLRMLQDRGMAVENLTIATALDAVRNQDVEQGVKLARQVFPSSSVNALDHLFLGRFLMAAGRMEDGQKELSRALELGPSIPDAWLSYVQILVQTRQVGEAQAAVQAASKALPADRFAMTLAQCHAMIGDLKSTESLTRRALETQPIDPMMLRLAARLFMREGLDRQADLILAKLADPKTGASPADAHWASRTLGLRKIKGGDPQQLDRKIAELDQDLKANPDDIDDQRARAILLAGRPSRRHEAIQAFEELEKKIALDPEEQFLLAKLHGANRGLDRCRDRLLELLGGPKKEPRYIVYLVTVLLELGDLTLAEKWTAEYNRLEPQSPRALGLEAALLKAKKQTELLRSRLEKYAIEHSKQIGFVAMLFDRYGFAKEAESAYRSAVSQQPGEAQDTFAFIDFLARQNRAGDALSLCDKAWRALPPDRVAGASAAVATHAKLTDAQAGQINSWLLTALEQQPNNLALQVRLARFRAFQSRHDEAEAIYARVLAADPYNAESLNNLAWHLIFRHHRGREALELVNRAIDVADEIPSLLNTRALAFMELEQPDRALRDSGRVVASEPAAPWAYFHLARAQFLHNHAGEALKALQHAQELGLTLETVDPLERDSYQKLLQELNPS